MPPDYCSHVAYCGTDGLYFSSEGRRAEDFFALKKIRRLRPGSNPRTWVPKASTLPLDHRSRFSNRYTALGLTWPLTEMSTRNILCGGKRRPVCRADNLTTFMCRLSWNLGASTSWNPQGLSRPVIQLLYLYKLQCLSYHRFLFSSCYFLSLIQNHKPWKHGRLRTECSVTSPSA